MDTRQEAGHEAGHKKERHKNKKSVQKKKVENRRILKILKHPGGIIAIVIVFIDFRVFYYCLSKVPFVVFDVQTHGVTSSPILSALEVTKIASQPLRPDVLTVSFYPLVDFPLTRSGEQALRRPFFSPTLPSERRK